jgi:hypothetical protein
MQSAVEANPRQMTWKPGSISLGKGLWAFFCAQGRAKLKTDFGITTVHLKSGNKFFVAATYRDATGKLVSRAVHKLLKPAPAAGWTYRFADGNPVNLRLENILLVEPEVREPKKCKPRVKRHRPANPVTPEQGREWLMTPEPNSTGREVSIYSEMAEKIGAILRLDGLAETIHSDCVTEVLTQLDAGKFCGTDRATFRAWCLTIAKNQAIKRQDGVLRGYVGDVEADAAAIKLKAMLKETKASFGNSVLSTEGPSSRARSKRVEGSDAQFDAKQPTRLMRRESKHFRTKLNKRTEFSSFAVK